MSWVLVVTSDSWDPSAYDPFRTEAAAEKAKAREESTWDSRMRYKCQADVVELRKERGTR